MASTLALAVDAAQAPTSAAGDARTLAPDGCEVDAAMSQSARWLDLSRRHTLRRDHAAAEHRRWWLGAAAWRRR